MYENVSDYAELKLYESICKLRKSLPEKDFELVDLILDTLIEFKNTYPDHDISAGFLEDLKGEDCG
tara:strand:- start:1417 stop:1614 length:198 start_codon:yes stop_codon:yes gene_type:complete